MHLLDESVDELVLTDKNNAKCQLLKTIKLPRNLKGLSAILPAPKYKSCKVNVKSKIPFIEKIEAKV